MDDGLRALVELCASLGARDAAGTEAAIARAAEVADPDEVEEALLQSYLFLGYPATLNAIAAWRERSGRPAPAPSGDDWEAWRNRGGDVCAVVYGGQYERLRRNIASLHPDMERWMLAEGYGKVLGRPGLGLARRELCIVALLAGQDAEPQLYAHLRGALNAGASADEVEDAVAAAGARIGAGRRTALETTWARVAARARAAAGD